ncbi:hypothetical protein AB0L74_10220 [Streptomyces sp. NPDC052020]|uniref:hypothetical protein n=1 Tax=Streptomyces sp. NPDC052020 TaxID=3155677 RepID=UPI00343D44EC
MARKVIEMITCDGCTKKGLADVSATVELNIATDEYHLCDEHGERFRRMLREALGLSENVALSA